MNASTVTDVPRLPMSRPLIHDSIDDAVRSRLGECPYRFVFDKITWQFADGTLRLRGRVPSFYLKQVLQERLRNIRWIDRIENEVAVISSTGLSSAGTCLARESA